MNRAPKRLFGATNPSGKLPICIPKSVGQLPLFYAVKPSGRGYAYCDDDGKPLFPFGFGLSYTTFAVSDAKLTLTETGAAVTCLLTNTGDCAGTEVLQLYLGSHNCDVVRPMQELKAYTRVTLEPGEAKSVRLDLDAQAFCYYDRALRFGLHDGDHTLLFGTSSDAADASFEVSVRGGKLSLPQV